MVFWMVNDMYSLFEHAIVKLLCQIDKLPYINNKLLSILKFSYTFCDGLDFEFNVTNYRLQNNSDSSKPLLVFIG